MPTSPRAKRRTKTRYPAANSQLPEGGQRRPPLQRWCAPRGPMWASAPTQGNGGAQKSSIPHRSPLTRHFCRAKVPCDGQRPKVCRSAGRSLKVGHTDTQKQNRKRVLTFFVSTLCFLCTNCRELQGFQKGRGPFVELRRSAAAPATSSWRLDTTLLCAAKKNGVEKKDRLAGLCQNQNGACRRARQ